MGDTLPRGENNAMALIRPVDTLKKLQETQLAHRAPGQNSQFFLRELLPRKLTREGVVFEQHIREGRFQRSLSLIAAFSSLLSGLDVLFEHYKGSFSQPIMYTPIILSPLLVIAGVWGAFSRRAARTVLPIVSLITMLDGMIGFIFHFRGIARKPGGWRLPVFNIIMGPPLFAPLLFGISGFLGLVASLLRREDDPGHTLLPGIPRPRPAWLSLLPHSITRDGVVLERDVREGRFQRGLALATALSAFFSGFESLYSHYKNNFTYKIEWTPILLTPAVMIAGFGASRESHYRAHAAALDFGYGAGQRHHWFFLSCARDTAPPRRHQETAL